MYIVNVVLLLLSPFDPTVTCTHCTAPSTAEGALNYHSTAAAAAIRCFAEEALLG